MSTSANLLHDLVGSMSQGAPWNPTVAMIEAAFAHRGLHWRYINMEVIAANLDDDVLGARAMGFRGFNDWTGLEPDSEVMRSALERALEL